MVCKGLATLGLDITVSTIICIAVFVIDFYNQVKNKVKIKNFHGFIESFDYFDGLGQTLSKYMFFEVAESGIPST
jgi:hypothetical protein